MNWVKGIKDTIWISDVFIPNPIVVSRMSSTLPVRVHDGIAV